MHRKEIEHDERQRATQPACPLVVPTTDEDAERFVAAAELTDYDLSGFQPTRFAFEKKTARVTMRLLQPLLDPVNQQASARGIPYQRFIREALERAIDRT